MGRIGTIINRKGKQDAKKSQMFTKLARYIMVAAKEGGADPQYNAALMTAIAKAKAVNMPNDNIDRAIKKGAGDNDGVVYTELSYEGYGPSGVAVFVECLTDNIQRTASDVRSYFSKAQGNLGTNGCVSYLFDRLGVFAINKSDKIDPDTLENDLIEAGVQDFTDEGDYYEIYSSVEDFSSVSKYLSAKGYEFSMAELRYLPTVMTKLENESDIKNMQKLIDLLEDNDDIQNIFHNWQE